MPALLGQKALRRQRVLLDCYNGKFFCIGPGGYKLQLSPGSQQHMLEESQAGHLMLSCAEFDKPIKDEPMLHLHSACGAGSSGQP